MDEKKYPASRAASGGIDYRFSFTDVIRFVDKHMNSVPFMLGVADNIGYFSPEEGRIRGNRSGRAVFRGCSAGITSIGIDSIGNVRGCESMYADCFIEGNLRERSLRDIWEDPGSFAYNRNFDGSMLTGKCAECCRSYNHFVHGRLYEAPFCARFGE